MHFTLINKQSRKELFRAQSIVIFQNSTNKINLQPIIKSKRILLKAQHSECKFIRIKMYTTKYFKIKDITCIGKIPKLNNL